MRPVLYWPCLLTHVGDPLYEDNWLNSSIWDAHVWNYTSTFDGSGLTNADEVLLVFDGIKMGANIFVNGQKLGTALDQFSRYVFPLKASNALRAAANTVTVSFDSSIDVGGRFMACSGYDGTICHLTDPVAEAGTGLLTPTQTAISRTGSCI